MKELVAGPEAGEKGVDIQRKDYGGGEMRFDGKLVRKDGVFLDPKLAAINPR